MISLIEVLINFIYSPIITNSSYDDFLTVRCFVSITVAYTSRHFSANNRIFLIINNSARFNYSMNLYWNSRASWVMLLPCVDRNVTFTIHDKSIHFWFFRLSE